MILLWRIVIWHIHIWLYVMMYTSDFFCRFFSASWSWGTGCISWNVLTVVVHYTQCEFWICNSLNDGIFTSLNMRFIMSTSHVFSIKCDGSFYIMVYSLISKSPCWLSMFWFTFSFFNSLERHPWIWHYSQLWSDLPY